MRQYFPKPYKIFGGDINVKTVLSNYATKTDSKIATVVDTLKLAGKSDLASLKGKVVKIDVDKLKTVVKKAVYDKLVEIVNNIDASGFALKTKYDTHKSDLEKK